MKRRTFIKNAGLSALGLTLSPYILPAGTLSRPSGSRIANHVVFCLFAGGIRDFESLQKKEGNLMPGMLKGNESISSDILPAMEKLPELGLPPLENFGTLYSNFKYNSVKTIHFTGHATAIMGVYTNNTQLMKPLNYPSVFEYYRKHSSPSRSAINAWWVSDQAGPFTYLNFSSVPGYGAAYGANMIQPTSFFNKTMNGKSDWSATDREQISQLQAFFNQHAHINMNELNNTQIENSLNDRERIEQLLYRLNNEFKNPEFSPWGTGTSSNEDLSTMYTATSIIKEFQPELLVVNMQHSDIGHSNFSMYCNNIRKADFALRQLWETIQSTPGMKDDTILIVAPEFGRNLKPNTLIDQYGRAAVDHTGDDLSQKIFCLIAGPPDKVKQGQRIAEGGETIDIVPTICKILGLDIPAQELGLKGRFLQEAFT